MSGAVEVGTEMSCSTNRASLYERVSFRATAPRACGRTNSACKLHPQRAEEKDGTTVWRNEAAKDDRFRVVVFCVFFFSLLISYAHSPTTGGNIETKDNCFCQLIIELIRCQPPFPAVRGQNAIRKSIALVGTVIGRTEQKHKKKKKKQREECSSHVPVTEMEKNMEKISFRFRQQNVLNFDAGLG